MGSKVLSYFAYVTVMHVYVGQSLSLLPPGITLCSTVYLHLYQQCRCTRRLTMYATLSEAAMTSGCMTDVGMDEVVAMLSVSVSLSSLLPLGIILCLTVSLH